MSKDRITQLRISGLRVIEDLVLDLGAMTVLIGDNGTGKSSILEGLELLRQAAKPLHFTSDVIDRAHGGLASLLRHGSSDLRDRGDPFDRERASALLERLELDAIDHDHLGGPIGIDVGDHRLR